MPNFDIFEFVMMTFGAVIAEGAVETSVSVFCEDALDDRLIPDHPVILGGD